MLKLGYTLCFALLVAGSAPGLAACNTIICVGVRVTKMVVPIAGKVYIATSGDQSALACNQAGGVFLTLEMDKERSSELYSAILASRLQGEPIEVRIDENSDDCTIAYIVAGGDNLQTATPFSPPTR